MWAAAAALALPLWLTACDSLPGAGPAAPSGGTAGNPTAAAGAGEPEPHPQAPPPAGTSDTSPGSGPSGTGPSGTGQTGTAALTEGSTGAPPAVPEALPPGSGNPATPGQAAAGSPPAGPTAGSTGQAPPVTGSAPEPPAPGRRTATAYFVLLDDGGSNGVRFGCNDSLVGLAKDAPAGMEPLPAAMQVLLAAGTDTSLPGDGPAQGRDTYNALAGSRLKFLSGTFDGTTVTVYLAGALSLGGVCDIPRMEAQLTQTALAAVDAVRAQVYLNGRPLAEVLRLDGADGL